VKKNRITRRDFVRTTALGLTSVVLGPSVAKVACSDERCAVTRPNLVYLLADQWRAQATGYAGDMNARTPNLDNLAKESVRFSNAVSGCPVCSPYRASLMTGRYPLSHGVFLNDVCLNTEATSIAQAYTRAGYDTGYIGKWHLDGHGRSNFIPKERRQGFSFWKALECTHDYNRSFYHADRDVKLKWDGYDAIAQTHEAQKYTRDHADGKPFALFLSWGPPHAPYHTAPEHYKSLFPEKKLRLRPNVPKESEQRARRDLSGYYAHIAALDDCVKEIVDTLKECGLERDTILVFTSDHGDMLHSHGRQKKQQPFEESIMVPFLLRYPGALGREGKTIDMPINTPDIMPTLLGLSGINIPESVEGRDLSGVLRGTEEGCDDAVLISCPSPFGQWQRRRGGKEYRGLRTRRYTYVRDLNGPWLLYDNKADPYQLNNLCNKPEHAQLQRGLEAALTKKLRDTNDEFLPGPKYIEKWGYVVNQTGTVPYTP